MHVREVKDSVPDPAHKFFVHATGRLSGWQGDRGCGMVLDDTSDDIRREPADLGVVGNNMQVEFRRRIARPGRLIVPHVRSSFWLPIQRLGRTDSIDRLSSQPGVRVVVL